MNAFDPDVVLLRVDQWSGPPVTALCGCETVDDQAAWAAQALGVGLDVLTRRGARVLWSQDVLDFASALRRNSDPLSLAMDHLTRERVDLVDLQQPGENAEHLLADAETYRRQRAGELTRVLVVGDSTAKTLGYGLERWAGDNGAVVWNTATEGCGIAPDGLIPSATGVPARITARCRTVWNEWSDEIRSFRPNLVIVLSELFDLAPRKLDSWHAYLGPGDRAFDDYIVQEYQRAYDVLASRGARVVWMRPPCARLTVGALAILARGALAPGRVRYFDDVVLRRFAASVPGVRLYDLSQILCPAGAFVQKIDGVELRPDGVHFGSAGSMWFAEHYGRELLDLARR